MSRRLHCLSAALPLLGLLPLAALAGCTIPETLERLDREAPPPELGRPDWVRFAARAGAVVGAIPGAAVSLAFLPVTYPISLLANEPLGYGRQEFLFLPVSVGASTGHFLLGAPADSLDWVFHRAWVPVPEPPAFDHVPLDVPVEPQAQPLPEQQPSAAGASTTGTEGAGSGAASKGTEGAGSSAESKGTEGAGSGAESKGTERR